jgi:acyl-coenzyme A thioesterase PaaI-like protein
VAAGSAPSSEKMQGAFTDSMSELVSYRYVGSQSVVRDPDHAEGHTTLRSHLLTPGSVSGAALAISMMDTAGINVDRVYLLGLTEVDLQLYEPARDVARFRTVGHVLRWARSQVFTECRFEDADQPGRVLGVGAANWSVIAPTPEGFEYTDPGAGLPESPDTPGMTSAFQLEPAPGGGWVLPALSPRVGSEVLHHGPILVGTEQSVLDAAAAATGADALALRSWTMRIVKAGRRAPFTVSADVLAVTNGTVGSRAELVDGEGETIAVSYLSHQVS